MDKAKFNYEMEMHLEIGNVAIREINKLCETLNGKSAIIPHGIYSGRWGKISGCYFSVDCKGLGHVIACIHPYNLRERDGSTLYDKIDARRYWKYEEFIGTVKDEWDKKL